MTTLACIRSPKITHKFMYNFIHNHTQTYSCIHARTVKYVHTASQTNRQADRQTDTHTHTNAHTHIQTHARTHVRTHACTHARTHTHTRTNTRTNTHTDKQVLSHGYSQRNMKIKTYKKK